MVSPAGKTPVVIAIAPNKVALTEYFKVTPNGQPYSKDQLNTIFHHSETLQNDKNAVRFWSMTDEDKLRCGGHAYYIKFRLLRDKPILEALVQANPDPVRRRPRNDGMLRLPMMTAHLMEAHARYEASGLRPLPIKHPIRIENMELQRLRALTINSALNGKTGFSAFSCFRDKHREELLDLQAVVPLAAHSRANFIFQYLYHGTWPVSPPTTRKLQDGSTWIEFWMADDSS